MCRTRALPEHIMAAARDLRSRMTDAEQLLWQLLRDRRFCGFKFRRQHPIGRFVIDFYCHEAKLAIELDGSGHNRDEQKAYDSERTDFLEGRGLKVLRFWNHDVLQNNVVVLEKIYLELCPSPDASRHPLPEGEGNL